MNGGIQRSPRFICSYDGCKPIRCECCLKNARHTVIVERANGRRVHVAACRRHRNMAEGNLRRFLAQRRSRDAYFAKDLAALASRDAG